MTDFPTDPVTGQQVNAGNTIWIWDGVAWSGFAANGTTGPRGFQGFKGSTGFTGATGAQGFHGATGAQGFQGATGAQGFKGATGLQGSQGLVGATGAQGAQGFTGATGERGIQGIGGEKGAHGFRGATGSDGSQGAQGVVGPKGATGAIGPQGSIGFSGLQGFTGATGILGGPSYIYGVKGAKSGLFSYNVSFPEPPKIVSIYYNTVGFLDISDFLKSWDDSTSSVKGHLTVLSSYSDVSFANIFRIISLDDRPDDGVVDFNVDPVLGSTMPADGSGYILFFSRTGDAGAAGLAGSTGPQGFIGATGFTGTTGAQGFTGATGAQGFKGATGPFAGSTGQVIYIKNGSAAGDSGLTYDDSSDSLTAFGGYRIRYPAITGPDSPYTLSGVDDGKIITIDSGSSAFVGVPTGLSVGFHCTVMQLGSGTVEIGATGAIPHPELKWYGTPGAGNVNIVGQDGVATIICYSYDVFNISGTLENT